jgi:hypothetical protein
VYHQLIKMRLKSDNTSPYGLERRQQACEPDQPGGMSRRNVQEECPGGMSIYEYHPVTPERLTDLTSFSEAHGKFRYCSCICWRLTSADWRNATTNCPFGQRNMQSFTRTGDEVDDGGVRQGHHVPHVPGDRRGTCTPDLAEATAVCIHRIKRWRGHVRRLPVAAIAAQSGHACTPRVGADGLRWSSPAGRTRNVTSRGRAARHPPSPRRLLRPYVCAR